MNVQGRKDRDLPEIGERRWGGGGAQQNAIFGGGGCRRADFERVKG